MPCNDVQQLLVVVCSQLLQIDKVLQDLVDLRLQLGHGLIGWLASDSLCSWASLSLFEFLVHPSNIFFEFLEVGLASRTTAKFLDELTPVLHWRFRLGSIALSLLLPTCIPGLLLKLTVLLILIRVLTHSFSILTGRLLVILVQHVDLASSACKVTSLQRTFNPLNIEMLLAFDFNAISNCFCVIYRLIHICYLL